MSAGRGRSIGMLLPTVIVVRATCASAQPKRVLRCRAPRTTSEARNAGPKHTLCLAAPPARPSLPGRPF
eukprot:357241-Chlamydomonas_euryale.AAC.3